MPPLNAGEERASTVRIAAGAEATTLHERGRFIYNYRCYFCHGYSGDAKTLAAGYLQPSPRDFTATAPQQLSREAMIAAVSQGRPGTAMMSFSDVLDTQAIGEVVDFIRAEFMQGETRNTRYHTAANGWPDHHRYAAAFPFVMGEVSLALAPEQLTQAQRAGRRLYMSACVTCHDKAAPESGEVVLNPKSISYPRAGFTPADLEVDAVSGASPYGVHEREPAVSALTEQEAQGRELFQKNCAFCHAPDGSGKNWIGSFLQPHPRNLTEPAFAERVDVARLKIVIAEGLPGTTMPAWKDVLSPADIDAVAAYVWKAFIQPQVRR